MAVNQSTVHYVKFDVAECVSLCVSLTSCNVAQDFDHKFIIPQQKSLK